MVSCNLRWSLWEFCFVSFCHLLAVLSALLSDVLILLRLAIAAAVCLSFLLYLRERCRIYTLPGGRPWQLARAQLSIGAQSARLHCSQKVLELELPSVSYFSEFLLVLCFRLESEKGGGAIVRLLLWPDSLARHEERRLRRYLRFDLPPQLDGKR